MQALMMDRPLLVSAILDHAAAYHGDTEVVSAGAGGSRSRTTYDALARRAAQLAHALDEMRLGPGDRVATLAWNSARHLELYYGVGGSGRVCHTINPRLFKEQIAFIIQHAEDRALFVEPGFLPGDEGRLLFKSKGGGRPDVPGLPCGFSSTGYGQ